MLSSHCPPLRQLLSVQLTRKVSSGLDLRTHAKVSASSPANKAIITHFLRPGLLQSTLKLPFLLLCWTRSIDGMIIFVFR